MSGPWVVRGGKLQTPLRFPVVLYVSEMELRRARYGPVPGKPWLKRDTCDVPPGTPGSVVFISVGPSGSMMGGYVHNPSDPYAQGTLSVAFFSGEYPQFNLTTTAGRKAMAERVRELKGSHSEGWTDARFISPILDVATTVTGAQTILNKAGKDGSSLTAFTAWARRKVSPSPGKLLLWFLRELKTVPTEVAEDVSSHDAGPSGYQFTEYSGFAMKSLDGRHLLLELLGMAPWLQRLLRSAVSAFTAAPVPYDGWLAYNTNPVWAELSNKDAYEQYLSEWEARRRNYPPFEWPNGRKLLLEVDLTRCTQRLMRQALNTYVERQGLEWWTALFDASPSSMNSMDKWAIEKVKSIEAAEEEMYKKAHFVPENLPLCIKQALDGNALNAHRVMMASVAKTISNPSLSKVFKRYAAEKIGLQDNGAQRKQQFQRACGPSSTLRRDTMLCSRRTSGPLRCPYSGGNNTIKCCKARGVRTDPNLTITRALVTPATNLAEDEEACRLVEDSHSRGELEGRQSVELKVNKRTASLEICYESDTKRPALESQPPTAPPCALEW